MTIEEAIKKAIEGGWRDQAVASILFVTNCDVSKIKVFINGFGYVQLSTIHKEKKAMESMRHEQVFMNPLFWQSLGKAMGWGKDLTYTKTGEEWGERFCLHCGVSTAYQPSKEITDKTGCFHPHYPEACKTCSKNHKDWKERWHDFINHLAEGKTAEDYFKSL